MPKLDGMELLQTRAGARARAAGRDDHRARHGRQRGRGAEDAARSTTSRSRSTRTRCATSCARRCARATLAARRGSRRSGCRRRGRATASSARADRSSSSTRVLERVADTPTDGAHHGRERHRQGARGARAARELRAARRPVHQGELRGDPEATCIESELFGYERGAFTGRAASQARPLRARVGRHAVPRRDRRDPAVEMQVKLLRVLQESEFERVGGHQDDRSTCASSRRRTRDLKKVIARDVSARTSTIGSTSCRSPCRRSASARPTSRCSLGTSSRSSTRARRRT